MITDEQYEELDNILQYLKNHDAEIKRKASKWRIDGLRYILLEDYSGAWRFFGINFIRGLLRYYTATEEYEKCKKIIDVWEEWKHATTVKYHRKDRKTPKVVNLYDPILDGHPEAERQRQANLFDGI